MKLLLKRSTRLRPVLAIALSALSLSLLVSGCSDNDDGEGNNGGAGGESPSASGGAVGSGGKGEGGEGPVVPEPAKLRIETVDEAADESDDNYDKNVHGLISGKTLKSWVDDWKGNRPAGIEGNLIIVQIVPTGVTSSVHITPKEKEGVFTYLVPANEVNQARDNGLSSFETDVPDGPTTDAWLKKYGFDPRKDLIVLTFEHQLAGTASSNAIVHSVGRAWVFLRYWGVAKEHLALLNGSVNHNAIEGYGLSTVALQEYSKPKNDGKVTVRDLNVDNTSLSISAEELIGILSDDSEQGPSKSGARIVDARGGNEAIGKKNSTNTNRNRCEAYLTHVNETVPAYNTAKAKYDAYVAYPAAKKKYDDYVIAKAEYDVAHAAWVDGGKVGPEPTAPAVVVEPAVAPEAPNPGAAPVAPRCSTPFEGRIKGGKSLPWTEFLNGIDQGFSFKTKAELKNLFDSSAFDKVDGNWKWDASAKYTIQYCRTNQRSTVTGIVANVVLGYPTRFYETSFIEWGHLANHAEDNKNIVPSNFAWRTDLNTLTEHFDEVESKWVAGPNYNEEKFVNPQVDGEWPKLDLSATTTRKAIDEDRAYLRGEDSVEPATLKEIWGELVP